MSTGELCHGHKEGSRNAHFVKCAMLPQHASLQKASLMEEKHLCCVGEVNQLSKTLSQNLCKNETELHGNGNFLFLFTYFCSDTHCFVLHTRQFKKVLHAGFQNTVAKANLTLRQWRVKCKIILFNFRRQNLFKSRSIFF